MAASGLSEWDWEIRLHIYRQFVAHERPPTYDETARAFAMPASDVRAAYHRLDAAHALFLEPGGDTIRMAHPLSAIATPYRVHIDGHWLYANCAWDALGIPAMLHTDARIEATLAHAAEPARYAVVGGQLMAGPELAGAVVHFALPFRRWYDDLIHT